MIQINLLPEEMRKRKGPQLKLDLQNSKVKMIAAGGAVGVLVLLILFLSLGSSIRKGQTRRLLAREQAIAAQKSEIEAVNNEVELLKTKIGTLGQIAKQEFLWAEKLNRISDLVLPGIWFTRIRTDSENRLIIEGSVISKEEEAMASVGKFMKDIRGDDNFFKDFANIKLESVQRKNIEDRDVVDFKIVLYFE
ncbi:MAG: PilN domain-containing protein [Candidatus Omnitrophica bacterium]|nr:PilN domain-containing protein [Candidatus Omnitrophota bacterium]MBU4590034.1 PilN domain-containing protein [Candidatus Omnitrophota bacterium]